jgi:predicted dehydrogenase
MEDVMTQYRVALIGAGHRAGAHDREMQARGGVVNSHAWAYRQVEERELVARCRWRIGRCTCPIIEVKP